MVFWWCKVFEHAGLPPLDCIFLSLLVSFFVFCVNAQATKLITQRTDWVEQVMVCAVEISVWFAKRWIVYIHISQERKSEGGKRTCKNVFHFSGRSTYLNLFETQVVYIWASHTLDTMKFRVQNKIAIEQDLMCIFCFFLEHWDSFETQTCFQGCKEEIQCFDTKVLHLEVLIGWLS